MNKEEDNEDSIRAAPNGQTQEVPDSLEKNDNVQQQESDGGRKREDKPDIKNVVLAVYIDV